MNFTAIKWCGAIGLAAGAAAIVGGGSASAQSFSGVLRFSDSTNRIVNSVSPTGVTVNARTVSFNTSSGGNGFNSSGSFALFNGGTIAFADLGSGRFSVTLSGETASAPLTFSVTSYTASNPCPSCGGGGNGTFISSMNGTFTQSSSSALSQPTTSIDTTVTGSNSTITLNLTPVPTPALVPAAVGFGLAMLRKRKQEESEEVAIEKV